MFSVSSVSSASSASELRSALTECGVHELRSALTECGELGQAAGLDAEENREREQ
jgi:hypothetical protein